MDAEVNGTPFSVLMQQAVKMKTAQSEPFKRTFESWPRFYQNSVFSKEDIVSLREKGDFGELMARAKEIKEDANKKVTSSNGNEVMEANHLYEQALSLFKWATNDDPKWKEKGMRDESISEHIYDCKSLKEREEVSAYSAPSVSRNKYGSTQPLPFLSSSFAAIAYLLLPLIKAGSLAPNAQHSDDC